MYRLLPLHLLQTLLRGFSGIQQDFQLAPMQLIAVPQSAGLLQVRPLSTPEMQLIQLLQLSSAQADFFIPKKRYRVTGGAFFLLGSGEFFESIK